MKIKIKVKSLIIIIFATLFLVLIVVPFTTLEIANFLDRRYSSKAAIFYESYLSKPIKFSTNEAQYKYAKSLANSLDKYQIMMQGWGGIGTDSNLEDIGKAKEVLKEVLNGNVKNKNKYYYLSYSKIMDLNISTGSPEELLYWIKWGSESEDMEINYISDLYCSYYHYVNRDYDLANKVLESYESDNEVVDYRYYYLKGDIALFQGNIDLAEELYKDAKNMGRNFELNESTLFGSRSFLERDYWFEQYKSKLAGNIKIRGKVMFNGKPMPFVEIYMQEHTNGYRVGGGDLIGITDINGEYETLGFEPARYEIGIGLSSALLYDKVFQRKNISYIDLYKDMDFDFNFTSPIKIINPKPHYILEDNKFTVVWEPVEGADYYNVETILFVDPYNMSGGNSRIPIKDEMGADRFVGTSAIFNLDKLKKSVGGLSWSGEEMIVNPSAILGSFSPGFEYPIVVNAYDKDRNLLGSSLAINSFYDDLASVKIEGKLSEGETLIINKKYEEAIDYYKNILEKNPSNEEALVYLTKIYMVSWKKNAADYDKAMDYAIRYNDFYNDNSLIYDVIGFMDHNAQRKYRDLLSEVFNNILQEEKDSDFYYEEGKFNLSIGEYELARDSYEKIDYYTHYDLWYIDLYLGDLDKALERIKSGNVDLFRMDKKILEQSLKELLSEGYSENDYKIFKYILEKILREDLSKEEGKDLYNRNYNKINNSNIKAILNQIRLDRYWDMDY